MPEQQSASNLCQIYVNALFFNESITRGSDEVVVAAKRQLCLCLSAILLCPVSTIACVDLLLGGLQQFAASCEGIDNVPVQFHFE